jgi:hypothetical protein
MVAPKGAAADLRELRREIESGSPLGLHLGDLLANTREVFFLQDEDAAPAAIAGEPHEGVLRIELKRSDFFLNLLSTLRAGRKRNFHRGLRGVWL